MFFEDYSSESWSFLGGFIVGFWRKGVLRDLT